MFDSITLLGSSDGSNAGDAGLLISIMDALDTACRRRLLYEIPTRNPGFLEGIRRHRVRPVPIRPGWRSPGMFGPSTCRSIVQTDLSLVFDGCLFDRKLYAPGFNFLLPLSILLPYAARRGKRFGIFNMGLGPIRTALGARLLRRLVDAAEFVALRDRGDVEVFGAVGAANPRALLTADPALNLAAADGSRVAEILRAEGIDPGTEFLAVNISNYTDSWLKGEKEAMSRETFLATYVEAFGRVLDRLRVPLVVVTTQHHDFDIGEALRARLAPRHNVGLVANRTYGPAEVKGVLGRAALLCGMRLHPGIFASSELTPAVALAYVPKVRYFFDSLGMEEYCLSFDDFSAGALEALLMRGWTDRKAMRGRLAARIPALRGKALVAAEVVAALGRGQSIDDILAHVRAQDRAGAAIVEATLRRRAEAA